MKMSNHSRSRANIIVAIQALIAGLQKHDTGQTLVIGGVSMAVSDVITKLTNYVTQLLAAAAAQAAWHQQVQVVDQLEATDINAFRQNLDATLRTQFGATSTTLEDFGLKPRKPAVKTVAVKNAAVEKGLATRASHHVPVKPPGGNTPKAG
jgi:hypothetical protein